MPEFVMILLVPLALIVGYALGYRHGYIKGSAPMREMLRYYEEK